MLSWLLAPVRTFISLCSPQSDFTRNISSDVIERAFQSLTDFFDFVRLDDQRGSEHQSVADHAQDQSMVHRRGIDPCADLERAVEGNAFFAVTHQLHADDEARPSHITDER